MSIDTYFCFCCLSTNDLMNLYSGVDGTNYASMLTNICSVKPLQDDYRENSFICISCARRLINAHNFKTQVFDTLHTLKVNGCDSSSNSDEEISEAKDLKPFCPEPIVMDDSNEALDEKMSDEYEEITYDISIEPDLAPEPPPLKQESIETNIFENEQSTAETESLETVRVEPVLEKEKRITVTRRKDKKTTLNEELPLYKINDNLTCDYCSETLPNLNVYHRHMNIHFPNHICETCGKGFLSLKRLKRHMPSHETGPFNCEFCDSVFTNYNTMNSHKRRKHGNNMLYKCTVCDERFLTFNRRMLHLADAHGQTEKKYKCTMCPSEFLMSGNLSSHMRQTHLKVKRFFCSDCNLGFFQKEDLRGHMLIHTGIKEFQCEICSKTFLRKKSLTVHSKIHNNDKRFCCHTCGKKFVQKCSLQRHFKVHEKDFIRMNIKEVELHEPLLLTTDIECYIY